MSDSPLFLTNLPYEISIYKYGIKITQNYGGDIIYFMIRKGKLAEVSKKELFEEEFYGEEES